MSNGAKTVIIESPDRFARDLMVQLAGHDMLKAKGISLIAASAPTHFIPRPPSRCAKSSATSPNSRRRPRRQAGGGTEAQAHRDRREGRGAQEPRRGAPGRCGAGKAARPQEAEGRGVEPAGDLGIAGRARPPQRARQAVQSEVGGGHARGASAVANWEEPYAPRKVLIQAAVIDHRKLLGEFRSGAAPCVGVCGRLAGDLRRSES